MIALRAHANGQYVTAENAGTAPLINNKSGVDAWEKFTVVDNPNGSVSLRANISGLIVTADNDGTAPLIANRYHIDLWEDFDLTTTGPVPQVVVPRSLEVPRSDSWDWGIAPVERLAAFALDRLQLLLPLMPPTHESAPAVRQAKARVHTQLGYLRGLRAAEDKDWRDWVGTTSDGDCVLSILSAAAAADRCDHARLQKALAAAIADVIPGSELRPLRYR